MWVKSEIDLKKWVSFFALLLWVGKLYKGDGGFVKEKKIKWNVWAIFL